jgi:hypothetical protein
LGSIGEQQCPQQNPEANAKPETVEIESK